jgi:DNA damage-binding protein 1
MIGQIDGIQKLHIRDIPLGEMPRRIAHQPSSGTLCVLTIKFETVSGEEKEVGYVRLLNDQTYESKEFLYFRSHLYIVIDSIKLQDYESPCSVISCSLGEDIATNYFVVGTAFALPNEPEPTKGRLLVYTVEDGKLKSAADPTEVKGAVYSLSAFNKRLLAGINSRVRLTTTFLIKIGTTV